VDDEDGRASQRREKNLGTGWKERVKRRVLLPRLRRRDVERSRGMSATMGG